MARTRPWGVGDELWARVEPLVPPAPSRARGGGPRMGNREAFGAIAYVLRTGIRWNALPRELGASSTVHARFQEWVRSGFFRRLHEAGLAEYGDVAGIEWEWRATGGAMGKAPLVPKGDTAGAAGPNPTDRGERGTKRSLLVDGVGIPLAVAVGGANRHDCKLAAATLDGVAIARPDPGELEQHLCMDAGYDYAFVRGEAEGRGYRHHIRGRGGERSGPHPDGGARRWVVERTHSRLNRSRRLLVRREEKAGNHLALLHLARARLIFAKLGYGVLG